MGHGCGEKHFKAEHTWDMVVVKSVSKLSICYTWLCWKVFQSWSYVEHGCGEKRFIAENIWNMVVQESASKLSIHRTWYARKSSKAGHTWNMVVSECVSKLSIYGTRDKVNYCCLTQRHLRDCILHGVCFDWFVKLYSLFHVRLNVFME